MTGVDACIASYAMLAFSGRPLIMQAYGRFEDASMGDEKKVSDKARGGFARAKVLSAEQRQDIARKAATSRWDSHLPAANYEGDFPIGELCRAPC
jgi:hypothetical protein